MRKSVLVLASTALAVLLVCGAAWADTFSVTNTKNSGPDSLRTAIIRANESPGKDIITFAPGVRGEIRLRGALPTLSGEIEVRGPGASRLTVRRAADRAFRVFTVAGDSTARITGLTISNGLTKGPGCCGEAVRGGGVRNEGNLTLRGVAVSANTSEGGGAGIYNGATLTVEDGTFSANRVSFHGGAGIWNDGTLTIRRTTFASNDGGGLFNTSDATIMHSKFSENSSGGISNESPAPSRPAHLTVRDTTFSGNRSSGGGAISDDHGEVTVEGSTFTNNTATHRNGGGIYGFHDTLTVRDSTFTDNTAKESGGGIIQVRSGTLTVEGSTFSGNTAREHGGGAIRGFRNTLTVTDSTFSNNTARGGGAIQMYDEGTLEVEGSTFLANSATEEGGGIFAFRGSTTVSNSTFARNKASHGGGLYYYGVSASGLNARSATFANNQATDAGGGIYSDSAREDIATIYPRATIVAGNDAPEGPDVFGPFDSRGYSLIGDTSGSSGFGGTDLTNTRAGLDPDGLQDNGGPTKTFALTQSSPAVDAVELGCPPPVKDQRGVSRPKDGDGEGDALCDIGAYEREASSSPWTK